MSTELETPCSFEEVLKKERDFIEAVKAQTGRTGQSGDVGIALSGGGIRSAAFQLGVLQALATNGVLGFIDYFSSVSGGGYIGGWFIKWFVDEKAKSNGESPVKELKIVPGKREPERILWLRKNSNYLTPHVGLLRHDSIFLATTYVHSLIFNLLVLFISLSALLLLVPVSALGIIMRLDKFPGGLEVIGGTLALGSLFLLLLRMVYTGKSENQAPFFLPYFIQALALSLTLILVYPLSFKWARWLTIVPALASLCWKKGEGKFGFSRKRLIRAAACSLVITSFIAALDYTRLSPDWPEIICLAWLWSAPIDHWFETGNVSQRVRRWGKSVAAAIGAFLITAFMLCRTDRKQIRAIHVPSYNDISNLLARLGLEGKYVVLGTALFASVICMLALPPIAKFLRSYFQRSEHPKVWKLARLAVAGLFTTAGVLFTTGKYQAALRWIDVQADTGWSPAMSLHVLAILTPLCITVGTLQFSFTVALLGDLISPAKRERIWGDCTTMYRCVLAWVALVAGAIYAPAAFRAATIWVRLAFICLWLASLVVGFWDFRVSNTEGRMPTFLRFVIGLSTYIFAVGLLSLVSMFDTELIKVLNIQWSASYVSRTMVYFDQFALAAVKPATWIYTGIIILIARLLIAALDVNLSSMHYFFQGRIARAFLLEHLPGYQWTLEPRTKADKMLGPPSNLSEFSPVKGYYGPLPIYNAALNLDATNVLDWQDRKAANFIFTPNFSGFDTKLVTGEFLLNDGPLDKTRKKQLPEHAYAKTEKYKYGDYSGIRLAAAMAISGSAIGSAMGSLTSIKTRILHTFLNLRLGWWFPNPRRPDAWTLGKSPQWWMVFKEFLGSADAEGNYVHLSDGGHFENLGVYELVKRKCKVIIISDASEDRDATFSCLSIAIQKCRVDFNYTIKLNIDGISPGPSGICEQNFALGEIDYGKDVPRGLIVYFRPTITAGQSTDVISFHKGDSFFPHHPTINQWFSESLFEAYREMGQFVAEAWVKHLKLYLLNSAITADEFMRCCDDMLAAVPHGAITSRI